MKRNRIKAIIDIGSHSLQLHVGEIVRRGVVRSLEELFVPIAVGRDTFTRGYVTQGTILDMIRIIKNYRQVLEGYGPCDIRAVATAGVREAANADTVVERIHITTGVRVQVIDQITEAEILYHGLAALFKDRYGFLGKDVLIFSLGAGGTQIIFQRKGEVVFTDTQNQGSVRLIRDLDLSESSLQMMLERAAEDCLREVTHYHQVKNVDRLVAVNDDVVQLVRKILPEGKVDGIYRMKADAFLPLADEIAQMGRTGFRARYGITDNLAETTRFAFIVISHIFRKSGARQICFPVVNTSSAMLEIIAEYGDLVSPRLAESAHARIISAAQALGEKYRYDAVRAERVSRLAGMLYDQMRGEYGFEEQERLYLEVAALLHNIGYFVSSKAHHKHSALLISCADILGLGRNEMRIIGQIARYHRQAMPKSSHEEYMELPERDRIVVYRMGALLRLADALCPAPFVQVEELRVTTGEESCLLGVRLAGQRYELLDILKLAVQRKSDLFTSFFGMNVIVERLAG